MAECPKCGCVMELTRTVLKQELVSLAIEWEGDLVEARTIGGMIDNSRKLFAAAAKEVGIPSDIFMHSIEWGDKRAKFNFLVIPRSDAPEVGEE